MRVSVEQWTSSTRAWIDGREYLAFAGCDYLGLAHDPRVAAAMAQGIGRYGIAANGSRETSGNVRVHEQLESDLAEWLQAEAAVLCPDGALANMAACEILASHYRVALIEERAHRSLVAAACAAGLEIKTYRDTELTALDALLAQHVGQAVVMTDSVFAADGQCAPLHAIAELVTAHCCALLVDDCHGVGVRGTSGTGCYAELSALGDALVVTTTLSKALGCGGGACIGRARFVTELRERAWAYRGTTPMPAALAHATRSAIARAREADLLGTLRRNIQCVRDVFARLGLPVPPPQVPIFAFCPEPASLVPALSEAFMQSGVWVPLIDYPGARYPRYFRAAISAAHDSADLARLEHALSTGLGAY